MKVKINRALESGRYAVSFDVTDFTPDELKKMESFGVPNIRLTYRTTSGSVSQNWIPLVQVSKSLIASFTTEAEAKEYEKGVVDQLRGAVKQLRERQDTYSSSEEVSL